MAAPRPIRFDEGQSFSARAYVIVALAGLLPLALLWVSPFAFGTTSAGRDTGLLVASRSTLTMVPVMLLLFNLLYMKTSVDDGYLTITFGGLIPLFRRQYRLEDILAAESVQYNPLREFGGWGIRRGYGGSLALTARGDEAVRVRLAGGGRLLIGSQRAEKLAIALHRLES